MNNPDLRITEIFYSLQGETKTVGLPTVFVRLTGCPLRCSYCDTAYAFSGGTIKSVESIIEQVSSYKPRFVTVTGGEPLSQPACKDLLRQLCDLEYSVSLETSGALPIGGLDERVSIVLDLKTPTSSESHRNLYSNIGLLESKDQVKFVICNREDYQWARFKIDEYQLQEKAGEILFSPSFGEVSPTDLAEWILQDNLPVRLQLQLHKLLWNDAKGR